jgi:hypothetical protein
MTTITDNTAQEILSGELSYGDLEELSSQARAVLQTDDRVLAIAYVIYLAEQNAQTDFSTDRDYRSETITALYTLGVSGVELTQALLALRASDS